MIYKVIVLSVLACLISVGLNDKSRFSVAVIIGAGILIAFYIISALIGAVDDISELFSYTGADAGYLKILLKCLAVGFLSQFASDICEDSGNSTLASQIIFASKIAILILSLPLIKSVFEICFGILKK